MHPSHKCDSVKAVFDNAQQCLANSLSLPIEESRIEAQALLQHCLNVNRAWLISHENDALEGKQEAAFEALLKRRLNGEPVAYILGKREFYGLDFIVTPDTLIPRPDTETLVEAALEKICKNKDVKKGADLARARGETKKIKATACIL